jgi:hypothetical protein
MYRYKQCTCIYFYFLCFSFYLQNVCKPCLCILSVIFVTLTYYVPCITSSIAVCFLVLCCSYGHYCCGTTIHLYSCRDVIHLILVVFHMCRYVCSHVLLLLSFYNYCYHVYCSLCVWYRDSPVL